MCGEVTPADRDLILSAIRAVDRRVGRAEETLQEVLAEAKKTNGRITDLETTRAVTAAVATDRTAHATAAKSRRRVWIARFATLASGAALAVLGWILNNAGG